jgi:hypothetical protein
MAYFRNHLPRPFMTAASPESSGDASTGPTLFNTASLNTASFNADNASPMTQRHSGPDARVGRISEA